MKEGEDLLRRRMHTVEELINTRDSFQSLKVRRITHIRGQQTASRRAHNNCCAARSPIANVMLRHVHSDENTAVRAASSTSTHCTHTSSNCNSDNVSTLLSRAADIRCTLVKSTSLVIVCRRVDMYVSRSVHTSRAYRQR